MTKYSVSHKGQEIGAMSLNDIVERVRARELDLFDYIFDTQRNDWILLMEFPDLAQKLKSHKPPRPPSIEVKSEEPPKNDITETPPAIMAAKTGHEVSDWYVLKGENRFGPFGFEEVIQMMQQKVLFPFDFVWHSTLPDWKRAAELSEFQPSAIRQMLKEVDSAKNLFLTRQFKRVPYEGKIIVHDNLSLWNGQGFEISKGGVGIKMANALVIPGQQLTLHFHRHQEWPAFNAACEVVSKKFVNGDRPIEYGFKFLSLSQQVQDEFYKRVS